MENEKLFCHQCGAEFDPKLARYCSQCGAGFYPSKNKKRARLLDDVEEIMDAPNPYEAMRFTASLVISLGWTVIIVGWASAVFVYGGIVDILQNFVEVQNGPLFDMASVFFVILVWALVAVVGVMIIAVGQFYFVLLDIRNDTHTTMRLIARLGLAMHEKQEPPAA